MNRFEELFEAIMETVVVEHVVQNQRGNRSWIVPNWMRDYSYLPKIINALETLPFKYITNEIDDESGNHLINGEYRILNIFNDPREKPVTDISTGALTGKDPRKKNNWERIWSAVYNAVPELKRDALNPEFDKRVRDFNWSIKKPQQHTPEEIRRTDLNRNS